MEYDLSIKGGISEYRMRGRLTYTDHSALRDIVGRIGAGNGGKVVFDVAQLEFVDSSGMGMLLLALDAAKERNTELVLRGAQGQVQRLFTAQKFENLFTCEF